MMVERILIPDAESEFSVIHGDPCFTNILIEETYNFMRLIDPRGSFGSFDIYGDSRYDLAKIFHSMDVQRKTRAARRSIYPGDRAPRNT